MTFSRKLDICRYYYEQKIEGLDPWRSREAAEFSRGPFCIGEERIYLHLSNLKKMHWYLAEYGPINRRFFGFFEDSSDGISSDFRTLDEILGFAKKGDAWEPMVDEDWKPLAAKEIPSLQGYIRMMICPPDLM